MKVVLFACSSKSYQLMGKLTKRWGLEQPEIELIGKVKCSRLADLSEEKDLGSCVKEYFNSVDAMVFLGATGIAVRSIAPCVQHKSKDPAVVVIDELGRFCISLLSGHAGGANELAEQLAVMIGATPVITTATDGTGTFAVDEFARKNRLKIRDWSLAKEISVALLEGEEIGFCSELPVLGNLPRQLYEKEPANNQNEEEIGIWISERRQDTLPFSKTLQLVPENIIVGIGCKQGTTQEAITVAIQETLLAEHIMPEAVGAIASITLKEGELGIRSYCELQKLPFLTYSPEELGKIEGVFSESSFVKEITGVSNVCERSAVAAGGILLCKKRAYHGVTIALAKRKGSVII